MCLGKISDFQTSAKLYLACQGRHESQDGFEESGLACAVWTNQCGALAAFQRQIGCMEERFAFIGISNLQIIGAQHQIT